jgi:hypothetical protein
MADCFSAVRAATEISVIILIILQTYLIVFLPRLNLRISPVLDRFGTMHLVATNIVIWMRVLVKARDSKIWIKKFEINVLRKKSGNN